MNLTADVPSWLPDLSAVPLDRVPALAAAVLEQRLLPGSSGTVFNSSI